MFIFRNDVTFGIPPQLPCLTMDQSGRVKPLHVKTPLIESHALSKLTGLKVWLKLENTQPVGTFKIRGIGNLSQKAVSNGCNHLVSSSGGNAGLAAAYAARKLNIAATIVVPETTPEFMRERLREEGATVEVCGKVWDEANKRSLEIAAQPGYTAVHPFDHPDIWEGHASMIEEIKEEMDAPDAVILSVGGGGLLCGAVEGLKRVGWGDVPVVAMETEGANCFSEAIKAGKVVRTESIKSIAKSLGSLSVVEQLLSYMKEHTIHSELVSDQQALSACYRFLDDQKMLVEPACGAALAAGYSNIFPKLQNKGKLPKLKTVVFIVCGGNAVSLKQLDIWKSELGMA
ncbi:unnamed protein product [Owenia fusiformis]|uniref:L-serine ammonia-lyase n=1 Tax=Owenia fusiformis TaxID=6347 RepID=A0A8J1TKM1_OWEFU|nr:unnamed protein product [Owenia fusiformis]